MNKRILGRTGKQIGEIGLGTWQLGTKWGDPFNRDEAMKILEAAYDTGITFVDTADVYNSGKSEETIGEYLREHPGRFFVTTKCGRRLKPHTAEMYTPDAIRGFVEGSLERLKAEQLDLILLHCPPGPVYQRDDIFSELDRLKASGSQRGHSGRQPGGTGPEQCKGGGAGSAHRRTDAGGEGHI